MKRITVLVLFLLIIPNVVLAAWWNPLDWVSFIKKALLSKEVVVSTLETEIVLVDEDSATGTSEATPTSTASTTKTKPTNNVILKQPPITPKQVFISQSAPTPTTSAKVDPIIDLLKQQNNLLKEQLVAQQQIIQNTNPTPTPTPIPITYPDPSTLTPASLGQIFRSSEEVWTHDTSGVTKNIIPINFNDAFSVNIYVYCPSLGSRGEAGAYVSYEIKASDFPNGYNLKRMNVGVCEYSLTSRDPLWRNIGVSEGTFDTGN